VDLTGQIESKLGRRVSHERAELALRQAQGAWTAGTCFPGVSPPRSGAPRLCACT